MKRNEKLEVNTECRDLGTHVNVGEKLVGKTVNDRVDEAIKILRKIRRFPISKKKKAILIRTAGLSKALYGCEAAPVGTAHTKKLGKAILDIIGPKSGKRSRSLAFSVCSDGQDLEPEANILSRRVAMLRRMMSKHKDVEKSSAYHGPMRE